MWAVFARRAQAKTGLRIPRRIHWQGLRKSAEPIRARQSFFRQRPGSFPSTSSSKQLHGFQSPSLWGSGDLREHRDGPAACMCCKRIQPGPGPTRSLSGASPKRTQLRSTPKPGLQTGFLPEVHGHRTRQPSAGDTMCGIWRSVLCPIDLKTTWQGPAVFLHCSSVGTLRVMHRPSLACVFCIQLLPRQ